MSIESSLKVITDALHNDKAYRESWKATIVMCYQENERWYREKAKKAPNALNGKDKEIIANNAAEYFLNLLCDDLPEQEDEIAIPEKPKKVITHLFIGTKGVGVSKNQFHFFWNGVFSNWHDSEFTLLGIKYSCAEQAMMYQKAITFNDHETAKLILATDSPREQKRLLNKYL